MRLLSLLLALLLASPALAVDTHPGRNRSSGGKAVISINDGGTITDYLTAEPGKGVQILGRTDGSTPCTGCVGEMLLASNANQTVTAGSSVNVASLVLTPGRWEISYILGLGSYLASTGVGSLEISLSTTSAGTGTFGDTRATMVLSAGESSTVSIPNKILDVSSNTTLYATLIATGSGDIAVGYRFQAVRLP